MRRVISESKERNVRSGHGLMCSGRLLCSASTMITMLLLLAFIAAFGSVVQAADKYERKSISYVPVAALLGDSVKVPALELKVFVEGMKIKLSRFDTNVLPAEIISLYDKRAKSKIYDLDSLKLIIKSTVVSEVVGVLQNYALERAGQLVDEVDEQTFIMTKAKELGITAADLRSVMNSAFIAIPYISKFRSHKTKDALSYSVAGGLAWYQIHGASDALNVTFVGEVSYESTGYSSWTESYYDKKAKKRKTRRRNKKVVRRSAMWSATRSIAARVKERTKELDPFNLLAGVQSVDGGQLGFDLGELEDVKLNDKYYIVEYLEKDDGTIVADRVGFGFVETRKGADFNRLSWLKVVKSGSHLAEGMSLVEHPRTGNDFGIIARLKQVRMSSGRFVSGGREYFTIPETVDLDLYLLNLRWSTNLARSTGISQFFGNLDVFATFASISGGSSMDGAEDHGAIFVFGGAFSLSRKKYIGAFAFGAEVGASLLLWNNRMSLSDSASYGFADISYSKVVAAVIASASLEYAVTIDLNIGVSAGYWQGVTPRDNWKLRRRAQNAEDPVDIDIENADRPKLDISGPEARIYFIYSLL